MPWKPKSICNCKWYNKKGIRGQNKKINALSEISDDAFFV